MTPTAKSPTVFISYSHDSPEHAQGVLALAWTLRDNGCNVELDQFHQHEVLDWLRWCREQVETSDFVVCVCTAEFQRRLNGEVAPEDGKGVFWEGNFLLTEIYNSKGNARFVPVLLGEEPASSVDAAFGVPTLCRIHDFTLSDAGFEGLVRILTNQPGAIANPVGAIPDLLSKAAPVSASQTVVPGTAPWHSNPIAISKLPRTGDYLIGRQLEVRRLTQAWQNPQTCIVQIVAPGGVGKTQLVKKWRERLLDKLDHGGAVRAFDWSFYSQGTQQHASADDFFDRALRWFGEAEPENFKDPWAKGERLAELVRQQPTLLILDGLEPLQHPPGPMHGELTDPSIKALLQGVQRDNPGLCVVTTREAVPTLGEMSEPKRVTIDLDTLSPAAGAELLRHYGVEGDDDELRQVSRDVGGHALALILLGTYVKSRCGGDVRQRSDALLFRGHERYAAHAHKVMAAYEAWFAKQDDVGRAAVTILRLMGLFNRPADAGCLAALRAEPPIPGLTEPLFVGDRDEVWQRAVERLRHARLLADDHYSTENSKLNTENSLDAHPLVREYFAEQLEQQSKSSSTESHRRLYEHLKQSAPELPDNLNDMMPLYHAVAHGCKAGIVNATIRDVYHQRILQGDKFYSLYFLGAYSLGLAALSHAFRDIWTVPNSNLDDWFLARVLNWSAFCLRSLGQMSEAVTAFSAGLRVEVEQMDFQNAAISARNLSETHLILGDVSAAVSSGEFAVELADRCADSFERIVERTRLGDALLRAGRFDEAEPAFLEAEKLQAEYRPEFPFLDSFQGFRYVQLLLRLGRRRVRERSERSRRWLSSRTRSTTRPLALAIETLSFCRAVIAEIECGNAGFQTEPLQSCDVLLSESVATIRSGGNTDFLPCALLARASFLRARFLSTSGSCQKEWREFIEKGRDAIAEAESIAERGSMLIWQIEAALERTRLYLALASVNSVPLCFKAEESNTEAQRTQSDWLNLAREKLDEAKRFVKQTEKPYEPHVPDWEDWKPPEYVGVFKKGEIVGYHCRNDEIERLQAAIDSASGGR